jgi:CRISPR/Cas system-associated exonuclease Cas4 (RecB family)
MQISPSELEILQRCPQRFVWNLDKSKKTRKHANLSSALGNIAHKVLALAHHGEFNSVNNEDFELTFKKIWDEIESEEYKKIESEWPNSVVPRPIRWPKYFAVKASSMYLIENLIKSGEVWPSLEVLSEKRATSEKPFPWVERFLASQNLKLKGIPDLVKKTSTGLEVIDYKTGSVVDANVFSMQLHIYLMLVNELSSEKVTKLLVRDFSLQETEVPIDDQMIKTIRNNIEKAEEYLITQTAPTEVSLENCRYCSFKGECSDFQNSKLLETSEPIFLEGQILQIHSSEDSSRVSLQLEIRKAIPINFGGTIWISGLSFRPNLSNGDFVQVSENLHLSDSLNVIGSWNTELVVI